METRYSLDFGVDAYRHFYDALTAAVTVVDCERGGIS